MLGEGEGGGCGAGEGEQRRASGGGRAEEAGRAGARWKRERGTRRDKHRGGERRCKTGRRCCEAGDKACRGMPPCFVAGGGDAEAKRGKRTAEGEGQNRCMTTASKPFISPLCLSLTVSLSLSCSLSDSSSFPRCPSIAPSRSELVACGGLPAGRADSPLAVAGILGSPPSTSLRLALEHSPGHIGVRGRFDGCHHGKGCARGRMRWKRNRKSTRGLPTDGFLDTSQISKSD